MKKLFASIALILCAFLLFGNVAASSVTIDPRVLDDTANGAPGNFIVVLKTQAATRILSTQYSNRVALGRAVYAALRNVAQTTQPAVRAQLDAFGAKYRAFNIVNAFAVQGNRAVMDALAARADVLSIESDRAFTVPLESATLSAPTVSTGTEWNVTKVGAPQLWSLGYNGRGIVYANADTGVQWDHPALIRNYRGWNGTTANHNYNWYDAIQTQITGGSSCGYALTAPCDDWPHGTHAMGTGIGNDGFNNQIGVAPGAQWIACRNMDHGTGRPSTYIACFDFFLAPTNLTGANPNPDLHPDVVGNSYGCPTSELCNAASLQIGMDNLRAAGIFMSVSAGNSGSSCNTVSDPPAIYQSAITIGATDSNDNIVGFSSRGPVTYNGVTYTKPDLVAPGYNIRSSLPTNIYGYESGTSMASPHVAGVVALLWSAFPGLRRDVSATENILEQSAVHYTTTQGCGGDITTQVPNNVFGYGRVDVKAAFDLALSLGYNLNRIYYFPLIFSDTPAP